MTGRALVIRAGTALVGPGLTPTEDVVIVVEDGSIVALGPAAEVRVPKGSEELDATGGTVMPGFIDAHVHIGFAAPRDVTEGGVTTVRDLGWPPDSIWPLVDAAGGAAFEGPTILAAGQILTAPGGYPSRAGWGPAGTGLELAGPDQAERAVEQQAERGAVVIKIALDPLAGAVLDLATLSAVTGAARSRGLRTTAHIRGLQELDKALEACVEELAHMLLGPERIPQPVIERMVGEDVTVVPTLSVRTGEDRSIAVDNLRRFHLAGGRVVYGTDLGNDGPRPGIDPLEIAALSDAGLGPLEIVRTATAGSAGWLGLEGTGVLKEGADADIVAVRGRPLEEASHLTRVSMVVRKGRVIRYEEAPRDR